MNKDEIVKMAQYTRSEYIERKGPNLKDKCLDVSSLLCIALRQKGVVCALQFGTFQGFKHAWVDVWMGDEVFLLDATATQFGYWPTVIFGKMSDLPEYGWED
jgi:transglutaminase-like putative cysteine protease